ncbi:MAG TPA: matrixin family metalloprotease, partial [Anaerolineales bacterium]|nr:matrixin family metalloprotease [Anaerolineales bacterium]
QMNRMVTKPIYRLIIPLMILMLACSLAPSLPSIPIGTGYRYDDLPTQADQNAIVAEYEAISKWGTLELTFHVVNGTEKLEGDTERDIIRQAFGLWASQTPLNFTETNSEIDANIVVGWAARDHGDGDPFDGPGDVLAHASFPNPYDDRQVFLHFDDDERWVNSDSRNVDLLTVAAHEIGHTLGLAHSDDPNALMFPSYDGPRRFLGNDDVAGIQALYGLRSDPLPAPDIPENGVPPESEGEDTDQDGIADQDETLITGTDPNNPDSDGDGLTDGVEVQNRMNPLDPDMDRDGVSDGQEVSQGSDPFFPEQPDVSSALEEEVSDFLTTAIELEIEAYRNGSADAASAVMAGDVLAALENNIASLNQQGLIMISEIDYYQSFINDIRVLNDKTLEVDTCEVWTNTTYSASDGQPVESEGPGLIPQTITIQELDSNWYITSVQFYEAPAFCG